MPRFPRREGEMIILADDMIKGLEEFGEHFPSADLPELQKLRELYQAMKETQLDALEAYKKATEEKDEALMNLVKQMKETLRVAERDVQDDPAKLERIGWGGSSEVTVNPPPGSPRDLEGEYRGQGRIHLSWKAPARGTGGKVAIYEVEKLQNGEWNILTTAFDTEEMIPDQAEGEKHQFRVIAKNQQGTSPPSNAVEVLAN